ncbi:hypothetical protein BpHYR1_016636 [Brachionus plicatilis]|uniref:DUF229 domain containing n=1 Tax=Brachionus plicatilis TaxID=10195 RepID=A0A3M7Q578_BRAPC|nr:hypothetical protein BpHYR1_016636 [Brachionus plicatilis]
MIRKIRRKKSKLLTWAFLFFVANYILLKTTSKINLKTNKSKIDSKINKETVGEQTFKKLDEGKTNFEVCQLPKLNYGLPLEDLKPMPKCTVERNWGNVDSLDHKWTLDKEIQTRIDSIRCKYRRVERIDDFKVNLGSFNELKDGDIVRDDVFEVECDGKNKSNGNQVKFDNLYVQVVNNNPKDKFNIGKDSSGCFPYNVMLLSYDSVSRVSFVKRLTKTFDFIKNTENFFILTGYNIVGDGTPQALIPLFTGYTEEELPSALKNDPNGKYVDEAYPFIWKELHKKNFTSIYLDDWPQVGAFSYRMRGFKNHAPKHYPKHYQLYMMQRNRRLKKSNDFCNGDTKRHKIMMNLLTSFKQLYRNRQSNLAIMHYVENSHDSNDHLHWLDDDIFEFLNNGFREHLFDDTIIFLNNLAKLTSPFDIHATVRDLTCSKKEIKNDRQRSISLFGKISIYRSCEDIGIAEHFCTCVRDWKSKNINTKEIKEVAEFAVESINSVSSSKRDLCQVLGLKKIISAEKLDLDGKVVYRVSFITYPNNGIYETIVYQGKNEGFEFISDNFSIKSKNDISRIDSYGEQPWCVAKFGSNPGLMLDLRKFCFCYIKKKFNLFCVIFNSC